MDYPEPLFIVLTIIIVAVAVLLIAFLGILFVDFKVGVNANDVERFAWTTGENLINSQLTVSKNVFDPVQLNILERDKGGQIEHVAYGCELIYDVKITSLEPPKSCQQDSDSVCKDLYVKTCGFETDLIGKTPDDLQQNYYRCSQDSAPSGQKVCQCKKQRSGEWVSKPQWYFYNEKKVSLNDFISEFSYHSFITALLFKDQKTTKPVYDTTVPVDLYILTYHTWLGDVTCAIQKSFDQKVKQEVNIDCPVPYNAQNSQCLFSLVNDGNQVCHFIFDTPSTSSPPHIQYCRIMNNVNVKKIYDIYQKSAKKKVVVYPIKNDNFVINNINLLSEQEACQLIASNEPSYLAQEHDDVGLIVLCLQDRSP
ncbi:MAG: hypothetical protein HY832_01410 [Candidatus Aenigmarchaeota archaeon]|nr:hypothetical protein [Candidatus Aenigmarchaeota archaeon]